MHRNEAGLRKKSFRAGSLPLPKIGTGTKNCICVGLFY